MLKQKGRKARKPHLTNVHVTNILLVFQARHKKEGPLDHKSFDTRHEKDLECEIPMATGRSTEILKRIIWRGVRESYQDGDETVYCKARFEAERYNEKTGKIRAVEIFRTVMPRKEIALFVRDV